MDKDISGDAYAEVCRQIGDAVLALVGSRRETNRGAIVSLLADRLGYTQRRGGQSDVIAALEAAISFLDVSYNTKRC